MLSELILAAAQGDALWMPDLRAAFASESDAADLVLRLRLIRGNVRDYPLRLPRWHTPEEQRFVAEYLYASVYNLLSVCSGQELSLYSDWDDKALLSLIQSLTDVFQVHRSGRRGFRYLQQQEPLLVPSARQGDGWRSGRRHHGAWTH